MGNKITTIKHVAFVGKWVELTFEEDNPFNKPEGFGHDKSCKVCQLHQAVFEAALDGRVHNNGYVGLKTTWEWQSPNWELVSVSE